jgi:hypothetical protein
MSAGRTHAAEPATFFQFENVASATGVEALVKNMHAHAAAWGDADGDGKLDLYVGSFHKPGTVANRLLLQRDGKFVEAGQETLNVSARSSGAVFVDLDNDGDLDFYLSNLGGGKTGESATGNKLFRNDGGKFVDVSAASHACPPDFRGRSVCAVDYDGDGLLDLLVGESVAYGSQKRSRLFRNLGNFKFEDVSDKVGLPAGVPALGVAAGDVSDDGWPDLLLISSEGGNRLFLNEQGQRFREAEEVSKLLQAPWKYQSGDDATCGACFADVNRDGKLDIVQGHHFERPWLEPVAIRLYLNRAVDKHAVKFEDVTDKVGLKPLPMKAPHIEVQDFDNDGWPDIYTSICKFGPGGPAPVIFKNQGTSSGELKFAENALAVNDFPTAEDRETKRTGTFFEKMIKEGKIIYTAAAPSGDFDNDGRVDIFFSSWWTETPGMLLKNTTPGGNWLKVQVQGNPEHHMNRQGIGARVKIYPTDKVGDDKTLLGCVEIAAGYGYSSGQEAIAHFGLGDVKQVAVEVTYPHTGAKFTQSDVAANQRILIKQE